MPTKAGPLAVMPVSGRYRGLQIGEQAGLFELDLRVDVDPSVAGSPVMSRISGDIYQVTTVTVPGKPPNVSKAYIESWIVDHPTVSKSAKKIGITGDVRFWSGSHRATSLAITFATAQQPTASVALAEQSGARREFSCPRVSDSFRDVAMEIDVCASVNVAPLLPNYDTLAHSNRPAGIAQRNLTIESAYREMGIGVTVQGAGAPIDDSAAGFVSWSAAELHDAMLTNFSRVNDSWPNWALWGLLAGKYDEPSVGGIMFDAAAATGTVVDGPDRRGFAVFRKHEWFDDLVAAPPAGDAQAAASRQFLYTWVHEAGHAFNLLHSWDKARPDSLSWMNYDWRYDQRNGTGTFWKGFEFRFDDDELVHIRHGNRSAVIMGGDPWSSGSHMESPNLASTQIEGQAPLEVLVRSKGYFELVEPVIVEVRIRNLLEDAIDIDSRLAPEFGGLVVFIQKPGGEIVSYSPLMCALASPSIRTLGPASDGDSGDDRYSREIFLTYGAPGFYFDHPGIYRLRAIYQGLGNMTVPSAVHQIRIGTPQSKDAERAAQDYFSDAVGLALYLEGSRSPYLAAAVDTLHGIVAHHDDALATANIAMALAHGLARPFYRLDGTEERQLVRWADANPEQALAVTERPLKALQDQSSKALNLTYGRIVRRRVDYHLKAGSPHRARAELEVLQRDLRERGVHPAALKLYQDLALELGQAPVPPNNLTPKRRRITRLR